MDKKLLFLQSCVRRNISTDDLGYLTKWLFEDFDNLRNEDYFNQVQHFADTNFFDRNITIRELLEYYNK